MAALTGWVLGHRKLVVGLWLIVTGAAFAAVGPVGNALSDEFSIPGREGFETNNDLAAIYGAGPAGLRQGGGGAVAHGFLAARRSATRGATSRMNWRMFDTTRRLSWLKKSNHSMRRSSSWKRSTICAATSSALPTSALSAAFVTFFGSSVPSSAVQ